MFWRIRWSNSLRLGAIVLMWAGQISLATAQTSNARTDPPAAASKKSTGKPDGTGVAEYRSQHFFMTTDLSAAEAKEQLDRLETMLGLISEYWGRPSRGIIEMYVAKDVNKFPDGMLPADGLRKIANHEGVTLTQTLTGGSAKPGGKAQVVDAKAVVYAYADRGVPQHEAVHAYCGQTFGRTGPLWYSEGMAEMGNYWRKGERAVNVHEAVIKLIHSSTPKTMKAIVYNKEATNDSWENYCWRWALCHMLTTNPNYSADFRPLGLDLLNDKDTTFEQVYGKMANEISFEYLFFLEHVDNGYREDLCSFDWKKRFVALRPGATQTCKVLADHGWQASQATLVGGQEYEFTASGTWKLSKDGDALTAAGDSSDQGRLVATVMKDFKLSDPIPLGEQGTFKAPSDGTLWVRCDDKWNELADNKGQITLKLKLKN